MVYNLRSRVSTLLHSVPGIDSDNTRTALLTGIPYISNRDHNNHANDIDLIVDQLARMRLANGEIALAIFIDHALDRAQGLSIATELRDLRDELRRLEGV